MSHTRRNFENSRRCTLNTEDDIELETCEQKKKINIFLGVLTPGDNKNLAGLASFDFRIL